MSLTLYAHPFSSFCKKVLIALWENDIPFTYRHLEDEGAMPELLQRWPIGKFPILVDDGRVIAESSIIIEYLDTSYPGAVRLLPEKQDEALEARFLDRFFDQYVMNAMQVAVAESMRPSSDRLEEAKRSASEALERAYGWLEAHLAGREWAAGGAFTLADCAAAPSLFYSDWVHQIADSYPQLRAYRTRLLARPSVSRAIEEGRKYRHYFPLGAPDRD